MVGLWLRVSVQWSHDPGFSLTYYPAVGNADVVGVNKGRLHCRREVSSRNIKENLRQHRRREDKQFPFDIRTPVRSYSLRIIPTTPIIFSKITRNNGERLHSFRHASLCNKRALLELSELQAGYYGTDFRLRAPRQTNRKCSPMLTRVSSHDQ